MLLSTSTSFLNKSRSLEEAIDIIAAAGFDAIDLSQYECDTFTGDNFNKEYFLQMRKRAEDKGLFFTQSHAPFPSSVIDEEHNKIIFRDIVHSIEVASIFGVETLVVHPCQHLEYDKENNKELLFDYNMDFYSRLIPYAEEYGVKIAVENMYQEYKNTQKIIHSTCSTPEEFIKYMDTLNNDCFVACLDIGHAALVSESLPRFIKALGNKYLKALHVHDVDGIHDSHTLPYFGIIDWDDIMKALADIGYEGALNYEADAFYWGKPSQLHQATANYMEATGRVLINKFEAFKK